MSKKDAPVREDVVRLQDCAGKVREGGALVRCGEMRGGACEELCFVWTQLNADRLAECVEAFNDLWDVLKWKEEVDVVDE